MSERYWVRNESASRTTWQYCEDRRSLYDGARKTYTVGYIIKKKNNHRCRVWLVYWYPVAWERTYIGSLKDMKTHEAKAAAQLLIGAQI